MRYRCIDASAGSGYPAGMKDRKTLKRENLRKAGLLHPDPGRVRDPRFDEAPEFFDSEDSLQVRYEMLRAHLVDRDAVSAVCRRFGVSRQTFYNLQAKFLAQGTPGLLPKRPGPKGPSKLTTEVLSFVKQQLEQAQTPSTADLLETIRATFGVSFHRRTLEKLLSDLRSKKNACARSPSGRKSRS
jgi:transposase